MLKCGLTRMYQSINTAANLSVVIGGTSLSLRERMQTESKEMLARDLPLNPPIHPIHLSTIPAWWRLWKTGHRLAGH
jgi:hypothetical protein